MRPCDIDLSHFLIELGGVDDERPSLELRAEFDERCQAMTALTGWQIDLFTEESMDRMTVTSSPINPCSRSSLRFLFSIFSPAHCLPVVALAHSRPYLLVAATAFEHLVVQTRF